MNDIAVVLPVRLNSERVENKMLRPFAGSNLYEICLDKLIPLKLNCAADVFVAAHEHEFSGAARSRSLELIPRTKESANAETDPEVYDFLANLPHEWICIMSACLPLLSLEAMQQFYVSLQAGIKLDNPIFSGVVATTKMSRWVWRDLPLTGPHNINTGDGNSKGMEPLYPSANGMIAFRRKAYVEEPHKYWPEHEPKLFVLMDDVEAMDIDTPRQFNAAEAVYEREQKCRRR